MWHVENGLKYGVLKGKAGIRRWPKMSLEELSEALVMSTGLLSLEDCANGSQFSVNSISSNHCGLNPNNLTASLKAWYHRLHQNRLRAYL